MTKRIALLTSQETGVIPDDAALLPFASHHGLELLPQIWDETLDWQTYDAVLIRTPWDYFLRPELFLQTLAKIDQLTRLCNPLETVKWNLNKGYLLELSAQNVPVPRTILLSAQDPGSQLEGLGEKVVVKPLVSASGHNTFLLDRSQWQSFSWQMLPWETHSFMAQEFLPGILAEGEISLIFFAGEFSHAVRKTPASNEFRIQAEHGGRVHPHSASRAELAAAYLVIHHLPVEHLYCRVDLTQGPDGRHYLMEVELIEPELFFRFDPLSHQRFLRHLAKTLK